MQQQRREALEKDIFLGMRQATLLTYTLCGVGIEYDSVERRTVKHNSQQMMRSGFTQPLPGPLTKETIEQEAICIMAGPAGEDMFNGEARLTPVSSLKCVRDPRR